MSNLKELVPAIRKGLEFYEQQADAVREEAAPFIRAVPFAIAKAASRNQDYAFVMRLTLGDDFSFPKWTFTTKPKPEWLCGRAKVVFDFCVEHGLQPHLSKRWYHDWCELLIRINPDYVFKLLAEEDA